MKTYNIKLLRYVTSLQLDHADDLDPGYRSGPLHLKSSMLFGTEERVVQVWHSASTFHKDDSKPVGYLLLPTEVKLNERRAPNFKFSCLSTSLTERFTKDWSLVLELPMVPINIQEVFWPFLFIPTNDD